MTRRRFSEAEVIETLLRQGAVILCYRTKRQITIGDKLEREHVTPVALGGADSPENCAYSFKEAHAAQTFGTKATTAGSDIHMIAKAKRIASGGKKVKRPMRKTHRKIAPRPFPVGSRPFRRVG